MFNIREFIRGIRIKAKTTLVSNTKGELEVQDSDGKLNYHNGSTRSAAVTEKHASQGTDRLENKDLDSASTSIVSSSDVTTKIKVDPSTASAGTVTTIQASSTNHRSITLPDASDTLVGKATTDTLTNKSIDADNNTISELEVDNFKAGVLDTDLTAVSATDDTIPSAKATKDYVDAQIQSKDEASEIAFDDTNPNVTGVTVQAATDDVANSAAAASTAAGTAQTTADDHIADTVDAHDASAISNIPSGNLVATEVQAALNELQTDVDSRALDSDLTTHVADTSTHGTTGNVVGDSDAQTLTNKTINTSKVGGGTASATNKILATKDTRATLDALAREEASIYYDTDAEQLVVDDGTQLKSIGAGAGSLDIFDQETFEVSVTPSASGKNVAFLGGGVFGGSVSPETTSPISGDQSLKYTAGVASNNDYFEIKVIDVDEKQRGQDIKIRLSADMSGFANDVTFVEYRKTATAKVLSSTLDVLTASTDRSFYEFVVFIPSDCTQISFGFHMNNGATNTESFIVDDVEHSTNPFVSSDVIESSTVSVHTSNGYGSTETKIRRFTTVQTEINNDITYADSATNGGTFTINKKGHYSISYTDGLNVANVIGISRNTTSGTTAVNVLPVGEILNMEGIDTGSLVGNVSWQGELDAGDVIRAHTAGAATYIASYGRFTITSITTTEHVITPTKSKIESVVFNTHAGFGSTNTRIPYFTNEVINTSGSLLLTDNDSTNGLSFTALEKCVVTTSYTCAGDALSRFGWSLNGSGTTELTSLSASNRLSVSLGTSVNLEDTATVSVVLEVGDTLRPHTDIFGAAVTSRHHITLTAHSFYAQFLAAVPVQKVAYIKDVKTSGTHGGSATANTVHTRDLNTLTGDSEIVALSANQFTLASGKYSIEGATPFYNAVNGSQSFLYNTTDASYDIDGQSAGAFGAAATGESKFSGLLTLTSSKTFEVRQWTQSTFTSSGLGRAADTDASNPQSGEVYTQVKITKLR